MRLLMLAAFGLSAFAAPDPTALEIVTKSCERESQGVELRRQYTWRQHDDVRQVEKNGGFKSRANKVFDVFYIDGTEYRRLVEKDGKPLGDKESKDEQAKLDRALEKHKSESDADRRKRREKNQKQIEEEKRVRAEVPKAYDFSLLGEESVNGRPCWKVRAEPKPGYNPPLKAAQWFPKVHGSLWIDKQNYEWAKVDAETLDSFSVALGMLRIGKGARIVLEQQFINNEIWAPVSLKASANARALLVMGGNFDVKISFKDYRKYSVSSTVTVDSDQNP